MGSKDIFRKPFDEGTKTKLDIYQSYLKEWLPVFLVKEKIIWKNIQIFDFCSGQGQDSEGTQGSPLITLNELNHWSGMIVNKSLNVRVVLNEFDKKSFEQLKPLIEKSNNPKVYKTEVYQKDFKNIFDEEYNSMKSSANLLFIDQSGIKLITEEIIQKIINLSQTDFLFFISSSFISRFGDSDEFNKYLKISKQEIKDKSYYHIHKIVLNYYRSLIPKSKEYYLAPFSIKKGSNIYGLVFGTNHTYGMEKFLNVCWKIDKQRGQANFDIDSENINENEPKLFPEFNIPNKRQIFENELQERILKKELKTDKEVYVFALNNGFLPKDANNILSNLKKEHKIEFGFIMISNGIHKINISSQIIVN